MLLSGNRNALIIETLAAYLFTTIFYFPKISPGIIVKK